jgi:type II secretory pathway component PulK
MIRQFWGLRAEVPNRAERPNLGQQTVRLPVRRRGMALLVIVVLVMFVSLAAYRYSFEMENEYRLTRLQEEQVQARLCAQSGIEYAASLLEQPLQFREAILAGQESSELFRRVVERGELLERSLVEDREESQWRFAILSGGSVATSGSSVSNSMGSLGGSLAGSSGSSARGESQVDGGLGTPIEWGWGMDNESAKLHIPTLLRWNQMRPGLARSVLMTLPEADEETVDGWLASLGVRTATSASQDALQMAMGGGMQSNQQRQQRTRSLDRMRLRWLGGDLDQNYRLDDWEETLMERLLSDPMSGGSEMSALGRELSKVNTVAMGQGNSGGMGSRQPGAWNRYLTWVHGERNERPDGRPRIWLNQPDLKRLHQELSQVLSLADANFIVAMRQYGPGAYASPGVSNTSGGPSVGSGPSGTSDGRRRASRAAQQGVAGMGAGQGAGPAAGGKSDSGAGSLSAAGWVIDWRVAGRYTLKSGLDLVDATLSVEVAGGASGASGGPRPVRQTLSSPLASSASDFRVRLAKFLSETTAVQQPILEGRVDITGASAVVLGAVPGMTPELAQKVVQAREQGSGAATDGGPSILSIGWLVEKGIVDWAMLRELEPHLTTRSDVFSLQSVGFRDDRTPVFRSTVMIDARQLPARVRDQRVWHPWDRGFSTESLTQSVP